MPCRPIKILEMKWHSIWGLRVDIIFLLPGPISLITGWWLFEASWSTLQYFHAQDLPLKANVSLSLRRFCFFPMPMVIHNTYSNGWYFSCNHLQLDLLCFSCRCIILTKNKNCFIKVCFQAPNHVLDHEDKSSTNVPIFTSVNNCRFKIPL